MKNYKYILESKTFWFGLLTAAAPLIGALTGFDVKQVIANNPIEVAGVWGAIAILLRLVTKDKIVLRG